MFNRDWISANYIRGNGLEIGAHHSPFPIRNINTRVTYTDKWNKQALVKMFPEILDNSRVPEIVIIDNGEMLYKFGDESQDFVIASHVFEHFESPITAFENHLRVLKHGGVLFYAIPEMTQTFDKERIPTDFEHVFMDYVQDPRRNNITDYDVLMKWRSNLITHIKEYSRVVDHINDEEITQQIAEEIIKNGRDVHYHCWDEKGISEIFSRCGFLKYKFRIELYSREGHEVFIVIKKA